MMLATLTALVLATSGQGTQWESLFDGKSLDGWVKRGGDAVYTVQDGAIVGETRPNTANTFLCTEREFGDFELELQFKVDNELNSGIQFRSNAVSGYKNGTVHGYQAEIDFSDRSYTGAIYDEARRGDWVQDLANNERARNAIKRGDWNHYRIVARGDRLQTWINGVPAADVRDDMTKTGFIGLQVHGVGDRTDPLRVMWKDIKIRDLGFPYREKPQSASWLIGGDGGPSKWRKAGTPDTAPGWSYINGSFRVVPGTGDIEVREPHGDADIYIEFMVDDNGASGQGNGNSGVYLMGRYELQVLNSAGQEPKDNIAGGFYTVKAADINMAYPAYQWQNYYIKFTAPKYEGSRKVANAKATVWFNGTLIHRDVEIPDQTGGGQAEGPGLGHLKLQDHGNLVRFRNAWIQHR